MKHTLLIIAISCSFILPSKGQKFVSDSTCMIHLQTYRTISCDETREWEIERSYDIIYMKHWISTDVALMYTFRKQTLLEISEDFTYDKYPSKNEIMEGYTNDGIKNFPMVINWQYVDLDKDGKWDQFRLNWFEPNAFAKRTMFCTIPDSTDINIPSQ